MILINRDRLSMKNKLAIILLILFVASPAFGASKILSKAMKAYKKHDYQRASSLLHSNLSTFSGKEKEAATLYLGIINNKSAGFYRSLHATSLESNKHYLSQLIKSKGKDRSQYASLFLGETYLSEGNYKKAIKNLKTFVKKKGINKELKNIAKIQIGLAYSLSGKKNKAKSYWNKLKNAKGSTRLALAAAKTRSKTKHGFNIKELYKNVIDTIDSGKLVSGRDISNILLMLNKANMLSEGLELVSSQHLDSPSFKESFKNDKQINFYDVSLLENTYKLLLKIGTNYLAEIPSSSKYAPTAAYYLMDSGIAFNDEANIAKASQTLASGSRLPKSLKKLTPVKLNAGDYITGKKAKADNDRSKIVLDNSKNPNVFAEVLYMCVHTGADCSKVIEPAKQLSSKARGRKYVPLNASIGHYLLHNKKAEEALSYLELARDKSNKNKISANDPNLLVDLAEAYRLNNVYLETLEIFFEMNHSFPAVRQIQEAVQGTYAMHQKSAGDVKIF